MPSWRRLRRLLPNPISTIVRLSVCRPLLTLFVLVAPPVAGLLALILTSSLSISDQTLSDFHLRDHRHTVHSDARAAARASFPIPAAETLGLNLSRTRPSADFSVAVVLASSKRAAFSSAPGARTNLLADTGALSTLARAEHAVLSHPKYPSFCLSDPLAVRCNTSAQVPTCAHPRSVLQAPTLLGVQAFDSSAVCARRPGTSFNGSSVEAFATALRANETHVPEVRRLLSRGAPARADPWALVSVFAVGQPFSGFSAPDDRHTEQQSLYDSWVRSVAEAVESATAGDTSSPFVYLLSSRYATLVFADVVRGDFRLAAPALIIVALLLLLHTRSPLLTAVAIIQVAIAFVPAYVLYYYVFGQRYFAALHIFAVYLVLGIAVDDVFIYVDAWRQTAHDIEGNWDGDAAGRLSAHAERAYRRAVGGMAVTSVTTAAAFALNASSPLMPISTFGIWACILVLMQFAFVATAFPCVLVIWEKYFRHRAWMWKRCCASRHRQEVTDVESPENTMGQDQKVEGDCILFETIDEIGKQDVTPDRSMDRVSADENVAPCVDTNTDPENVSVRTHDDECIREEPLQASAKSNEEATEIPAVFLPDPMASFSHEEQPIEQQPKSANLGVHAKASQLGFLESIFNGVWTNTVYKLRYPLTVFALLLLVISIVLATQLETQSEPERLMRRSHPLSLANHILAHYIGPDSKDEQLEVRVLWGISGVDRSNTSRFAPGENIGSPIVDTSFDLKPAETQWHLLRACRAARDNALLSTTTRPPSERVRCWLEDFLAWRTRQNRPGFATYKSDLALVHEVITFGTYLDDARAQPYLHYLTGQDVMVSADLRRIVASEMRVKAPVRRTASPDEMGAVITAWEKEVRRLNAAAPRDQPGGSGSSSSGAMVSSGDVWPFAEAQWWLVRSLRVNVGAMLAVAAVVLALATRSVVCGVVAATCLGGIVSGVLGAVFAAGWQVGMAESVIAVVSVGYSFDGVCHIATSFGRGEGGAGGRGGNSDAGSQGVDDEEDMVDDGYIIDEEVVMEEVIGEEEQEHQGEGADGGEGQRADTGVERVRGALTAVGASIAFGAASTAGGTAVLLGAEVVLLRKLATLVLVTMVLGILWALILLPASLGALVPSIRTRSR